MTLLCQFLPKRVGWLCPLRSAFNRTPVQNFNSFSIMFYYIIITTYQTIGHLFCPDIFWTFAQCEHTGKRCRKKFLWKIDICTYNLDVRHSPCLSPLDFWDIECHSNFFQFQNIKFKNLKNQFDFEIDFCRLHRQ